MVRRFILIGACLLGLTVPARAVQDAPFITPEHTPSSPFTLPDLSGRPVSSADFTGRVAVLSFGATWCANCTGELKSLENLQAKLGKDVVVYFVALDGRGEKDVRPFMEKNGHHLPTLIDPKMTVAREHGIRWIPVTLVVDRQGMVAGRAIGPREWDGKEAVDFVRSVLQH